jgi:hypothetical protein
MTRSSTASFPTIRRAGAPVGNDNQEGSTIMAPARQQQDVTAQVIASNHRPAIEAPPPAIPASIRDSLTKGFGLSDSEVADAVEATLMMMSPGLIIACWRMRTGR